MAFEEKTTAIVDPISQAEIKSHTAARGARAITKATFVYIWNTKK
jgi:hypothetical protein